MKRLLFALAALGLVIVVACKQGKDDRCQIDDDCCCNLVCNKGTNTCEDMTGGNLDATVPDAPLDAPDAI